MSNTLKYYNLAKSIINEPDYKIGNTIEKLNTTMVLDPKQLIISPFRKVSPYYLIGELLWYFSGSNKLNFINQYSTFWNNISDDNETCRSAYGFLWQEGHGFDQVENVIKLLTVDTNSRQAIIHLHKPNNKPTKDEICTLTLQFLVREDKLNMIVNMRSNDLTLGTPYDTAMFSVLQQYIANKLNIQCGIYYHNAGSTHIYNKDLISYMGVKYNDHVDNPGEFVFTKKFFEQIQFLIDYESFLRNNFINTKSAFYLRIEDTLTERTAASLDPLVLFMGRILLIYYAYVKDNTDMHDIKYTVSHCVEEFSELKNHALLKLVKKYYNI